MTTAPLKSQLEAILFVATRPLSIDKLAGIVHAEAAAVETALGELAAEYDERVVHAGGVQLLRHAGEVQLVTSSAVSDVVREFLKAETTGELTKPAVETLSIIAYRGPVTKSDLEKIRGVNCTLILRNLMMRGLVIVEEDKKKMLLYYTVSSDFIRHLGLTSIQQLPQYETLHRPEVVDQLLAERTDEIRTTVTE
ncbi:MAG: SMC-Scp complex subunit ScpB [Patescibacteria group bacterium]